MLERPPERLTLDRMRTPLGQALLITDENHRLRALDWEDHAARMQRQLRLHYGATISLNPGRAPRGTRAALEAYFAGGLKQLDGIECHTGGTSFQRAVWAALRAIPPGRTMSYGALAAALGLPRAVRAVGRANGANPISIVVPCHRVIGADGSLTGYGGGLERKPGCCRTKARLSRTAWTPSPHGDFDLGGRGGPKDAAAAPARPRFVPPVAARYPCRRAPR